MKPSIGLLGCALHSMEIRKVLDICWQISWRFFNENPVNESFQMVWSLFCSLGICWFSSHSLPLKNSFGAFVGYTGQSFYSLDTQSANFVMDKLNDLTNMHNKWTNKHNKSLYSAIRLLFINIFVHCIRCWSVHTKSMCMSFIPISFLLSLKQGWIVPSSLHSLK